MRNRRRVSFFGDTMSDGQIDHMSLVDFGGTFIPPESGNRGEKNVRISYEFIPEVLEEEERLNRNDFLHWSIPIEECCESGRSSEQNQEEAVEE